MNMDIEESIDQQLANITDFECDSEESEIEELVEFDAESYEKELTMGGSKWLDLFVERTKEQEIKRNEMMKDVNETIQIINRTISNRTSVTNITFISSEEESSTINDAQDEKDEGGDKCSDDEDHESINPEQMLMMNSSSLLPSTTPLDKEVLSNLTNIEQRMNAIQLQVDDRISQSQLLDQKCKEELEANVAKQYENIDSNRRVKEDHSFQKQIEEEQQRLQQLQKEMKMAAEVKKKEAAITIQKHLRGYSVRKMHSEKVEVARKEVKVIMFNRRVRALDNKREKEQEKLETEQNLQNEKEDQRIKEEQMIKEEQRLKEKQERLQKEQEQRLKEEQERLKKEEEQRIIEEQERLKREKEQQRIKEEEERLQKEKEELRIKEEQERLKKEKERRIKEEQERIKSEQEQRLKKAQERLQKEKEEEERLRMEKEQQRIKEEKERLTKEKEEEERLRMEKEQQIIKEEEERLRKEKEHEEMVKMEEEMRFKEEQERIRKEEKTKSTSTKTSSQAFEENLTKWRESISDVETPRIQQISRESRRSSSSGYQRSRKFSMAAQLTPITEKELIQATWPYHREETRTMETLQRVYMQQRASVTSQGCMLTGDQRCVSLTHVTMNYCGLEAVEGFENLPNLKHFDVSHNQIKFGELSGMTNVESISLSHNRLTSLHGVSTCKLLVYLDLSHNDFSKTPSNLNQLDNLLHLRLNNNTLLNVRNSLPINLITLDLSHNHVTSLEGVQWCVTLNNLRASDNNLTAIESHILRHLTQLTRLDLSTNSIDNMAAALSETWLPSLTRLDLATNQIQADAVTSSLHERMPNLVRLDVSGNLISDIRPLLAAICSCAQMRELLVAHNLPQVADDDKEEDSDPPFTVLTSLEEDVPGMRREELLWEELMILGVRVPGEEEFGMMLDERLGLEEDEVGEMKMLKGWSGEQLPPDHVPFHCRYLKEMFRINQHIRAFLVGRKADDQNVHPDPDTDDDISIADDVTITTQSDRCDNVTSLDVMMSSSLLELPNIQHAASLPMTSADCDDDDVTVTSSVSMDCSKLRSARKSNEDQLLSSSSSKKNERRRRNDDVEDNSNRTLMTSQHVDDDDDVTITGDSSSEISNYQKAEMNMWGEDELPEVDLSALEFDEDLFDRQWAVKTDFHENVIMQQQSAEHMIWNTTETITTTTATSTSQRSSASAKLGRASSSKFPLPPIPPSPFMDHSRVRTTSSLRGTSSTAVDPRGGGETNRSRLSAYEEKMMQEWNISSDLLLKRAEKLSGRRKKKGNADAKFKRFQQVNQNRPKVNVRNYKEEAQERRIDYFKAQETRGTKAERQKSEDDERRKLFTYEWLNQSEDNFQQLGGGGMMTSRDDEVRTEGGDGGRKKSAAATSFLPPISLPTKKIIVKEEEDDLEMLSVNSFRSGGGLPVPPKDYLLRDIVRRHHRK